MQSVPTKIDEHAASLLPFSEEAAARRIEQQFLERLVAAAARSLAYAGPFASAMGGLKAPRVGDEALMRFVESGVLDDRIDRINQNVERSGLRSFDEAEPFSYDKWAARKRIG